MERNRPQLQCTHLSIPRVFVIAAEYVLFLMSEEGVFLLSIWSRSRAFSPADEVYYEFSRILSDVVDVNISLTSLVVGKHFALM